MEISCAKGISIKHFDSSSSCLSFYLTRACHCLSEHALKLFYDIFIFILADSEQ